MSNDVRKSYARKKLICNVNVLNRVFTRYNEYGSYFEEKGLARLLKKIEEVYILKASVFRSGRIW